jgi:hypothetical protein
VVRVIWERPTPIPAEIHRLADRVSVRGRVVKEPPRQTAERGVLVRVPSAGLAAVLGTGSASDAAALVGIRRELQVLAIGVEP